MIVIETVKQARARVELPIQPSGSGGFAERRVVARREQIEREAERNRILSVLLGAFATQEKKYLLLDDGSTHRSAELVSLPCRVETAGKARKSETLIAEVVKAAPMKQVATGVSKDADFAC